MNVEGTPCLPVSLHYNIHLHSSGFNSSSPSVFPSAVFLTEYYVGLHILHTHGQFRLPLTPPMPMPLLEEAPAGKARSQMNAHLVDPYVLLPGIFPLQHELLKEPWQYLRIRLRKS